MEPLSHWAACGAMWLTGDSDGPPLAPPTTAASALDVTLAPFGLDAGVLGERAAHLNLSRRGSESCGGRARLLEAADGWIVLSLPRADDVASLPALVGVEVAAGAEVPWPAVEATVARRPAADVVGQATLLGVAAGVVGGDAEPLTVRGTARAKPRTSLPASPLVVDLSALWAGPLCAHLLGRLGAEVVKVEAIRRPDGARSGVRSFYDLLNAGKRSVAVDLSSPAGRERLTSLVETADIVITSARSRAVEQLGLDPDRFLAGGADRVWVAVTGHGWDDPRIGFGDDAAAGAGLVAWGPGDGRPRFVGDAIADPLCGAFAAHAAWEAWTTGGRWFVDAPLAGAAAQVVRPGPAVAADRVAADSATGAWVLARTREPVRAPVARRPAGAAAPLGADTEAVLARVAP